MNPNEDILASLSLTDETPSQEENILSTESTSVEEKVESTPEEIVIHRNTEKTKVPERKFLHGCIFIIKYISTSTLIFFLLLLGTNYQAYYNVAYSYIFQEEMQETKEGIIRSVHASTIEAVEVNSNTPSNEETFRVLDEKVELDPRFIKEKHAISRLTQKASNEHVALDIEITPYENRIIIPRIGRNIPLVDIMNTHVSGSDELEDIFMDELEEGVVRYPGSAKPGEGGNSFIFGHSSNFPWMQGNYNDVFALLDNVIYGDEIIVYYNQKKYVYKIYGKDVIKPGDVSVLHSKSETDAQITLMTCWPIGTTLNRLILTGDLISVKDA